MCLKDEKTRDVDECSQDLEIVLQCLLIGFKKKLKITRERVRVE